MIQYLGIEVGEIRVCVVMVASIPWTYEARFESYTLDKNPSGKAVSLEARSFSGIKKSRQYMVKFDSCSESTASSHSLMVKPHAFNVLSPGSNPGGSTRQDSDLQKWFISKVPFK